MNLFNFISLVPFSQFSFFSVLKLNIKLEEQLICNPSVVNKHKLTATTITLRIKSNLCKVHNSYHLLLATESIYHFTKSNINKPNLFKQLTNKYWQQSMFLSYSTPLSKKYINNLVKKDSLAIKNKNKKNLINFSKALLNGSIDSKVFLGSSNGMSPYVEYIWRKGYNIEWPKFSNKVFFNNEINKFFNKKHILLSNMLKYNKLPLFVVVNNLNQMVISEPGEELLSHPSLVQNIYKWYTDHFLSKKYNNKIYEGWFFINPYDAIEYKDHIKNNYIRSYKYNGLNIMPTGLDFYYDLNRYAMSNVNFRLLPDLVEVSKLIKLKSYRKDLIFHPNQKHGKSYFQGQPIYIIQPIGSLVNGIKQVNYFYHLPNDFLNKKYHPVFLNKDVALLAWTNFRKQMPSVKLPQKPILMVYNLEDFLKDYENNTNFQFDDIHYLLVPNKEAYEEISKNSQNIISQKWFEYVYSNFYPFLLTFSIWSRRALWSLISRQPPN